MTKVLNLDELETSLDKTVVIKGVEYAMKALSVEDFINQMKEIDAATGHDMTANHLSLVIGDRHMQMQPVF